MEPRKINMRTAKVIGYTVDSYTLGDTFYIKFYEVVKDSVGPIWRGGANVYYLGDYIEDLDNITETERALLLLNLNIELVD